MKYLLPVCVALLMSFGAANAEMATAPKAAAPKAVEKPAPEAKAEEKKFEEEMKKTGVPILKLGTAKGTDLIIDGENFGNEI